VGIAGAGTVLNAWALVEVATTRGYRASNPASATLVTDSVDASLLARVRALPFVRDVQARRSVAATVQSGGVWLPAMLYVFGNAGTVRIGSIRREAGAWPPRDSAVVIEHSSLDYSGLSVGESVQLAVGQAPPVALQVSGVARDVGLAPGWMEHVVYAYVTQSTLARLGAPASLNELQIVVRPEGLDQEAVRRLAYDVARVLREAGHPVRDVNVPVPGEHIHAGQMDSLLFTQGAFGVLALLLSAFLVVNLMAAMLAGQVREIGVMKTLGAGTADLTRLYLTVALFLGVVATGLGVPVAMTAGRWYAQLKADLLNFPLDGYRVPWWVVAGQVLVGLTVPVVAALVPVRRACRISVGDALRDVGIVGLRVGHTTALFAGATVIRRPLLLSLRNTFRKRQRLALTLATLSLGGAVFLGARNLRASVVAAVDLVYRPQRFDFSVRLADSPSSDRIERVVRQVAGVA
ncbi:MAG: FtsX-like permease family protein, partial [Gemmatimonadaceae bacterium]